MIEAIQSGSKPIKIGAEAIKRIPIQVAEEKGRKERMQIPCLVLNLSTKQRMGSPFVLLHQEAKYDPHMSCT